MLSRIHIFNLLSVAASGSAIGDQLKELGGYIGRFTEEIKKEQKAKEEAEKKAKEKEGRIRSLQMGAPEIGNRNESGSPEQVQIPIHPSSSVPAVPTNFQVPPPPSTETQTPEYVEKSPQILANEAKVWEAARMEMERSLPKAPTTSSLQDGSYPRSSPEFPSTSDQSAGSSSTSNATSTFLVGNLQSFGFSSSFSTTRHTAQSHEF